MSTKQAPNILLEGFETWRSRSKSVFRCVEERASYSISYPTLCMQESSSGAPKFVPVYDQPTACRCSGLSRSPCISLCLRCRNRWGDASVKTFVCELQIHHEVSNAAALWLFFSPFIRLHCSGDAARKGAGTQLECSPRCGSSTQLQSSCRGFPQAVRENAGRARKLSARSWHAAEPPFNPSKCKFKCLCALQLPAQFRQLLSLQTQCNSSNRQRSLSLRGSASKVAGALLQRTGPRCNTTETPGETQARIPSFLQTQLQRKGV